MLSNPHAERLAFWHIIAGDTDLLQQLQAQDFHDGDLGSLFLVCQQAFAEEREISLLSIDHRSTGQSWYKGFEWLLMVPSVPYTADARRVIKILRELRARREASSFDQSHTPANEIPKRFIDKGSEIGRLLHFDARPMQSLAEELKRETPTVPTGYPALDDLLGGGIEHEALFVIAARPGIGKTTMALNIAAHAIQDAKRVFIASLEMSQKKIAERALCCIWGESLARVRAHAEDMLQLPGELIIEDRMSDLADILSAMTANIDCDLFVIDYFQLVTQKSREMKQVQLENISRSLKLFAHTRKKPVILLSQLNRDSAKDKREPDMHDIRGSGALEQDADVVTFLHDPNQETEEERKVGEVAALYQGQTKKHERREIKWLIRKNRNGPRGEIPVIFDPLTFTFTEARR